MQTVTQTTVSPPPHPQNAIHECDPALRPLLRLGALFAPEQPHIFSLGAEGVLFALGSIGTSPVAAYAFDPSRRAGALNYAMGNAIAGFIRTAAAEGRIIVGLNESSGADIHGGIGSLMGYGEVFRAHVDAQAKTYQISGVFGKCCGGAVYAPALTDRIYARDNAYFSLTGLRVAEVATGFPSDPRLGSCVDRKIFSGLAETDEALLQLIAQDIRSGNLARAAAAGAPWIPEFAQRTASDRPDRCLSAGLYDEWRSATARSRAFDIRRLVAKIFDQSGVRYEFQADSAPEVYACVCSLVGEPIAVLANNSAFRSGVISASAAAKAATFIQAANARGMPIITFVDTPGFLPTRQEELNQIELKGAALFQAYAQASVPKISIVVGKGFGGALVAMGSKPTGSYPLVWPEARIAVMQDEFLQKISKGGSPALGEADGIAEGTRIGAIHGVIADPLRTREVLYTSLRSLRASP